MKQESPLAKFVRLQIVDYVDKNDLEVGERLPSERELADKFGVSRASLRKALAALETAGIVSSVQGSGTYLVRPTGGSAAEILAQALLASNQDLPDVVPVRSALESLAAQLAAIAHTEDDANALRSALDGMEAALLQGEPSEPHSKRFHLAIWKASGNSVLVKQLKKLQPDLNRLRDEALAQPKSLAKAIVSHEAILQAILERDSDRAAKLMGEHILEGAQSPLARSSIPMDCF